MELLRRPPFPLELTYAELLPVDPYYTGAPEEVAVVATFSTSRNTFLEDVEAEADTITGSVTFELPERFSRYDGEYSLIVYEGTADNKGDVLLMDTVRVVRPYINTADIAPVGKEDEYIKYERIARTMIDNIVGGFYYQDALYDLQGVGADKLPVGHRVNKLLEVVENNVLVYEIGGTDNICDYGLTTDKTSIIVSQVDENDLQDSRPVSPVIAGSDSYDNPALRAVTFPNGYNYRVYVETGWPMVPQDIKEATQLIIEDMACGSPNYWSKYVREYETKDYRVDFHRPSFAGTGNLLVDQILHRYIGETLYDNIRVL